MEFSQLLQAARQFERMLAQQLAPLLERTGLTMGEARVLLFLANNPGAVTPPGIWRAVRGLGKSQVSQAVELLVGKGLLERCPSQRDRRDRPSGHHRGGMAHGPEDPGGAGPVRTGAAGGI